MDTKYIFVTGGVVSGLGKGITAASLGRLLKARGYKVTNQKFDPYINIDPGTMSPYQHGEVFVTEDGGECDLDVGHYERFTDENLHSGNNVTSGKIYWSVLNRERKGEYLGVTVQVIPHITNEIKERMTRASREQKADIVITEIGGTVGDIECLPFYETIRQLSFDVGRENVLYVHVTLIPYLSKGGEMKSKPTQHSVKELLSIGIQPDIIVCRTEREMSKEMKDKIGLFCNVREGCVIQNMDAESLYEVPVLLEQEGLGSMVCQKLGLPAREPDLTEWCELITRQKAITKTVEVALVGKYVELHDAYLSIVEALNHAGIHNGTDVNIRWINAEEAETEDMDKLLSGVDAVLVPGGFGLRGMQGKLNAVQYARERKMPFLGICLGMQCTVIEYARHMAGLPDADSSEYNKETKSPVIDLLPEQRNIDNLGGTMRLGAYPCQIEKGSLAYAAYGEALIQERHRHRYEVNEDFHAALKESGLIFSGLSPDGRLAEIVELPTDVHPWFVGVQFHPEFKSRPNRPHPLFRDFVKAILDK